MRKNRQLTTKRKYIPLEELPASERRLCDAGCGARTQIDWIGQTVFVASMDDLASDDPKIRDDVINSVFVHCHNVVAQDDHIGGFAGLDSIGLPSRGLPPNRTSCPRRRLASFKFR